MFATPSCRQHSYSCIVTHMKFFNQNNSPQGGGSYNFWHLRLGAYCKGALVEAEGSFYCWHLGLGVYYRRGVFSDNGTKRNKHFRCFY